MPRASCSSRDLRTTLIVRSLSWSTCECISDEERSSGANIATRTNLDWIFVFKNYGPEWRRYRRAFHAQFHPAMITQYETVKLRITRNLLRNLLATPEDFSYHIKL